MTTMQEAMDAYEASVNEFTDKCAAVNKATEAATAAWGVVQQRRAFVEDFKLLEAGEISPRKFKRRHGSLSLVVSQ